MLSHHYRLLRIYKGAYNKLYYSKFESHIAKSLAQVKYPHESVLTGHLLSPHGTYAHPRMHHLG